jgi:hypothetical protein
MVVGQLLVAVSPRDAEAARWAVDVHGVVVVGVTRIKRERGV